MPCTEKHWLDSVVFALVSSSGAPVRGRLRFADPNVKQMAGYLGHSACGNADRSSAGATLLPRHEMPERVEARSRARRQGGAPGRQAGRRERNAPPGSGPRPGASGAQPVTIVGAKRAPRRALGGVSRARSETRLPLDSRRVNLDSGCARVHHPRFLMSGGPGRRPAAVRRIP